MSSLTPEKWEQVKEIFYAALRLPTEERQQFLNDACQDEDLRREVESLLSSSDAAGSFMQNPAVAAVAQIVVDERSKKLRKGQVIGHYKILKELGAGGQGAVYQALDMKLNRQVALKVLPPELTVNEISRKRFQREAQLASALDHPNICTIHDLIEIDGTHFIVMQFVAGRNIRELVGGCPLELHTALKIGIQVCDALVAAHAQGIIHRDIKAQNIIVADKGQAKILDFGLAKLTREKADGTEQTELTALGSAYGTPTYAAPEQSRGERVDHRADIFSSGVLLYEMLAGTWPFHGKTAVDVRHAVLYDEPKLIAERRGAPVPENLQKVVNRALEKQPDKRFQNIAEMRDALIEVLRELPEEQRSKTGSFLENFKPFSLHRSRTLSNRAKLLSASAVLLVLIFAGFMFYRASHSRSADGQRLPIKSIAVLPLKSLDAGENYLGLGIADAVIGRINQTGKLIVRPTSAVRRYLNEDTDALTAARQLNADAVLDGSVQRAGDRLRVSVNLLRSSDGASLWADTFDMRMTDIFTIQDTVAQQVASRLQLRLDPSQQARLAQRSTSNPVAYEYYIKGIYSFDQRITFGKPLMETTIGFFKQAIEADPNFALAHAQLAYAYATKAVFLEPTEPVWVERAREEINRAEALDPQLAETHLTRYQLLFSTFEGFQGEAAVRELLLAQQLNPNVGHAELAYLYNHLGLEDLAARELQREFEIDPTSEFAKKMTLLMYELGGKYDEYAAQRKLYSDDYMETWYFMGKGKLAEAEKAIEEWSAKRPDDIEWPPRKALLFAMKGDFRAAETMIPSILSKHPVKDPVYHHAAYDIACIYALEGKSVEAVKWLRETALNGLQPYPQFERDAMLDRIRQAPEFIQFMAEMKAQNEKYRREFA